MGKLGGLCTITNVHFCNYASLPTDDDHGSVIGSIPPFEIIPDTAKASGWCLFDLDNHRYSIQNVYSQYFLDTETRPEEYANVRGSRPGNRQYTWKIVESETAGQYFIFAENPTTLCWALSDESDKTPIELRGVSSDPRNLWKIISLDAEAKQLPFADKLGVCLKEALIRPGSENFTVRVDWEGLPLGTIDFLESISVMYHRRVIAVARPMQDSIATESKTLFATLSVVDATAFGEFVSSVVTDSAVQVTLSAGRLRFHGLDRELSRNSGDSNIYRMETMLNLKGTRSS
ncbi:hypothetical protein C8R44DRAFT_879224 [Mycena epipterygia]|nr:hypothetical protein C8R44DRAFT_879224 [Mycena epipterygia]